MDTVSSDVSFAGGSLHVPLYPHAPSVIDDIAKSFLGVLPIRPSAEIRPDYVSAFRAWENLLGAEHVRFDGLTRDNYAKTTLPVGTTPAGVVRPHTVEEVQEVVKIARLYAIPLHAISRGKNWGYGDACAPQDGYVIVELTRMNRIREVNVELGYAVIEPGVSQGQMYEYIRESDFPLLLDVTGAGPDASIVGNILQRGFGHTPYGDRFRHTSGFEVVLPDGRLVRTGFGQYENARAAQVFPWGKGPWIDGLFTQSDYGIVTSACIWLMPKPEVIEGFALKIDGSQLGELIDVLRTLRMNGTIRSTVHVANDLRVLSSRIRYPWERCKGRTPLPSDLRSELRREHGVGAWNLIGGLYGTEAEIRGARCTIRRALSPVARVHFFRRPTLERVRKFARWIPNIRAKSKLLGLVDSVSGAFELLEGSPSHEHLKGARWRNRTISDANSDLRNSGLIWHSPVVPMTSNAVRRLLSVVESTLEGFGFESLITLTTATDRSLCCVISINYCKSTNRENEKALACLQSLRKATEAIGYYSYRQSNPTQ
jgi:4-cresol dehydrogenase (hydroxylating)